MNTWLEALRLALRAVSRSALRSALTVLGVLIGIAAVVVVVALGESARQQVNAQIESLGSNLIYVFNGAPGGRSRLRPGRRLSAADARAIREQVPGLRGATVYASLSARVRSAFEVDTTDVAAGDEDYAKVRSFQIVSGRDFTLNEVRTKAKVALIGQTARRKLFGEMDPVGQWLRIAGRRYQVIGMLSRKGLNPFGADQDDRVVLPVGTWQTRVSTTRGDRVDLLIASVKEARDVEEAKSAMDALLRERHRLDKNAQPDFNLVTQDQFRKSQEEVYRVLSLLLSSVAAVSLFVGGVGVMNILLVSVTERQKEIGTRLALGARGADIRLQFLTEAVVLTLLGGAAGILLSAVALKLLERNLEWPLQVNAQAVAAALITCVGLGVVFGFWPAHRASQLDPIDALRS
jgi:putative ABC transport system permease protein